MEGLMLVCHACTRFSLYRPQGTGEPCCPLCQSHFVEILLPEDEGSDMPMHPFLPQIIPLVLGQDEDTNNNENELNPMFSVAFGIDPSGTNPHNALDLIRLMMNPMLLHRRAQGSVTGDYVFGETAFQRVLDSLLHQGGHATVGLTEQQMDHLDRVIFGDTHEGAAADTLEGSSCTICQEWYKKGEELIKLKCGHLFHALCLEVWLNKAASCPICRSSCL